MTAPKPTAPAPDSSPTATPELAYFVEGMDCASCVQKVEAVMARLPGAADVKTSFTRQTLKLRLDETQTPRDTVERNLRALGYVPTPLTTSAPTSAREAEHGDHNHAGHDHAGHDHTGHTHEHPGHKAGGAAHSHAGHTHEPLDRPWFQTGQGRLVLLSGALLLVAWALSFALPQLGDWAFVAATLVGVFPLARRALAAARLGDPFSIDMLVTLAAVGALFIGEAAEGAVVVFFFAVGELLEGVAAGRARAGVKALAALAPRTAQRLSGPDLGQAQQGQAEEVPADALRIGDLIRVRPGDRVPADGTIQEGRSALDDSAVTGESVPVEKGVGDTVYAGSVNADGVLTVRVTREAHDNTIARILHLVEEAEESRAPTARFIERFSRWYTPGVVLVAALTALVPPLLFGQAWHGALYRGLSLLLIGCPCALVLSVPAAITSGLSAGTRRGLLVKGGAALETLGRVKTVAFDKTGTLTAGSPRVTAVLPLAGQTETEALRLAAGVEAGSTHPLAQAITRAATEHGAPIPAPTDARALAGAGVSATIEGRALSVTSPRYADAQGWLSAAQTAQAADLEAQGQTVAVLTGGRLPLALIALRDEPRPDAAQALSLLERLGVTPVMLTGDNARAAQATARMLGLPESSVQAELKPEDKLRIIGELPGPVAMVGDGINDAPALARADVSIAMGGGTEVALETAHAALLAPQVRGVAWLVELSRAVMSNIRQNVAFALGLKAVFLVLTLLGITNLWMAILADTGATALVTLNALRLLRWQPRQG